MQQQKLHPMNGVTAATVADNPTTTAAVHISALPTGQIKQFAQSVALVMCDSSRFGSNTSTERTASLHTALSGVLRVPAARLSNAMNINGFQQAVSTGNPALEQHLLVTLAMLRGLATFCDGETYETSFLALQQMFPALLQLLELYGNNVTADTGSLPTNSSTLTLVTAVLKVFRDIAEAQISYLQPADAQRLVQTCVQIVQMYSQISSRRLAATNTTSPNKPSHSTTTKRSSVIHRRTATPAKLSVIDAEVLEDSVFNDVTALLELMQFLQQADDPTSCDLAADACMIALAALQAVLTTHILALPTIPELYFQLLQSVVSTYPEKLTTLPAQHRTVLLSAVDTAIRHPNTAVVRSGFKVVQDITEYYQHQSQPAENRLTQSDNKTSKSAVLSPAELQASLQPAVERWMITVLEQMLFVPIVAEVMDSISDALLALLVVNLAHYSTLVQQAVGEWSKQQRAREQERQSSVTHGPLNTDSSADSEVNANAERLRAAFGTLTSANGLRAEIDRPNRLKFRNNLRAFLSETRAITYYR